MRQPSLLYEKKLWRRGFKYVAGVDEVGRGCFAGPVVAACVAFAAKFQINGIKIDDSKKLRPREREAAAKWIKKNAITWGVGEVSAKIINRLGMSKATKMAFRRAVSSANRRLKGRVDYLLIDAFYVPYLRGFPVYDKSKKTRKNTKRGSKNPRLKSSKARQLAIVNGDEKSFSIASASIVAKVYRDGLMKKIGSRALYRKYDWTSNKGYATRPHQEAILKYGITGYHRKQFVETYLSNRNES